MIEIPFPYSHPVSGRDFVGRERDVKRLRELLSDGDNVVILGARKSGKRSLLAQTLAQMKSSGAANSRTVTTNLLNVRDSRTFASRIAECVMDEYASTREQVSNIQSQYFTGTHITFDSSRLKSTGVSVMFNGDKCDDKDIRALLQFPFHVSGNEEKRLFLMLEEFQCVRFFEDNYQFLKLLESILGEFRSQIQSPFCSIVFYGSELNAMKEIFTQDKWFFRLCEVISLSPIQEEDILRHIERGFNSSGKVVEREQITNICHILKNNIWYITHLFSICDHLSKGYIVNAVIDESLNGLMEIHSPRFISTMNDLTGFQVNLLRAIIDGQTRFSSAEVIKRYGLHSTANVKRLKDALVKKEIVTFDENDEASIIDPLFEYWVTKYYFGIQ